MSHVSVSEKKKKKKKKKKKSVNNFVLAEYVFSYFCMVGRVGSSVYVGYSFWHTLVNFY